MKPLWKTLAVWLGMPLLLAALFGALAAPRLAAAAGPARGMARAPLLQSCTRLQASAVAWVTLTANFDIDKQVTSYPSGVELITPVFEYNCVPSRVSVTTIYSLNGDVVFSDKETLAASTRPGLYAYPLGTTDGTALPDGEWTVEYYNGSTLLTSGSVRVGETSSASVAVEGSVKDKKTRRGIRGATVLVLVPGVTAQQWVNGGQKSEEVLTAGQSDAQGKFVLNNPVLRGQTYSLIIVARGYKPIATDRFLVGPDVPAPAQLDVLLNK